MFDIEIGSGKEFGLEEFHAIVFEGKTVGFSDETRKRLYTTRRFIDHLLKNNIKVYGLTTGFADLRNKVVSPDEAAQLSHNILQSHDAAIGPNLPLDITLGAMVVRANSLANGNSGFTVEGLQTLVDMINARIIPCIPDSGSLGASGDLAFLSRLGRAMQGYDVEVIYKNERTSAENCPTRCLSIPVTMILFFSTLTFKSSGTFILTGWEKPILITISLPSSATR